VNLNTDSNGELSEEFYGVVPTSNRAVEDEEEGEPFNDGLDRGEHDLEDELVELEDKEGDDEDDEDDTLIPIVED